MQRQAPVFLLHKCIGDWIFSFICKSKQNKHMDYDNGVSCNSINWASYSRTGKKDMQMFFIFLFMLCNMSLFTNYTKMFLVDIHYDIEQSVYLELLVVIGGFFFFKYWNRIPEGVDLRRLVMRKMRRGYQFLARMTSIIFVGIILGGNCWSNLPDSFGMAVVKGFAIPLVNEAYQGRVLSIYALNSLE